MIRFVSSMIGVNDGREEETGTTRESASIERALAGIATRVGRGCVGARACCSGSHGAWCSSRGNSESGGCCSHSYLPNRRREVSHTLSICIDPQYKTSIENVLTPNTFNFNKNAVHNESLNPVNGNPLQGTLIIAECSTNHTPMEVAA